MTYPCAMEIHRLDERDGMVALRVFFRHLERRAFVDVHVSKELLNDEAALESFASAAADKWRRQQS